MKKLYELDPSKEFNDGDISATSDDSVTHEGLVAGHFETVSGVGVESELIDDEEQENNLQQMLAKLNARTDEDMLSDLERQEQERERYRLEEEERLRQAKEKFNRERYEKEQAALAKRREEEELERQEEERRKAEEAERRKNNPLFKFANKLSKKNKEEDTYDEVDSESTKKKILSFGKKKKDEEEVLEDSVKETKTDRQEVESLKEKGQDIVEDVCASIEEEFVEEYIPVSSPEEEFAPEPEEVEKALKDKEKKESVLVEEVENEEENAKKKFSFATVFSKPEKKEKVSKEKPVKQKTSKSERSAMDDEPDWKYIATHDELTGLLNTRAYNENFAGMSSKLGIVFFDINNLKYLNDNFGHDSGNKLIVEVASTIQKYFKGDNLYRIGGDEFIYLIEKPVKGQADKINDAIVQIYNELEGKTKKEKETKMVYSVSAGYAIGDGKATKEEVLKAAEASMYQNKKAYKMSHPELDTRGQGEKEVKKEKPQPEHDELLTKEQRQLKNKIKEEHEKVSKGSTQQIMREVQRRAGEIEAIFIASPSFDHLFVITDIDDFLDIMEQQKALIDYSYLYIVYHGGPQYYGADEYYKEVTHLFEEISDAMMSGKFRSEKDIQNIPGINIFKNIYV